MARRAQIDPGLEWRLRRATASDVDAIHTLLRVPEVYRYLCDGEPPPRPLAEQWIELNRDDRASDGQGLWLLEGDTNRPVGCVALGPGERPRARALDYLLHPDVWGRGLATRMSWTVVERAFREEGLEEVVAGTDAPNRASVAVMRRLGMSFSREVTYPLGPGVEYVRRRDDPSPDPVPEPIAWSDP